MKFKTIKKKECSNQIAWTNNQNNQEKLSDSEKNKLSILPKCRYPSSSWLFQWLSCRLCISGTLRMPPPVKEKKVNIHKGLTPLGFTYIFPTNKRLTIEAIHIANNMKACNKKSLLVRSKGDIYTAKDVSKMFAENGCTSSETIYRTDRLFHDDLGKPA